MPLTDDAAIGRRSLGEEVAEKLRAAILNGQIRAREWIKEDEICERFKVSRTPVREALTILERDGLVASIPYKGRFVNDFSDDILWESYLMLASLEQIVMESVAAQLTREDFLRLDALVEKIDFFQNQMLYDELKTAHRQFHMFFIDRCKYARIADLIKRLYSSYPKRMPKFYRGDNPVDEYRLMLGFLRAGDEKAAGQVMKQHILDGGSMRLKMRDHAAGEERAAQSENG
jgi:DNA-binding GntR family transcriptional regulator